VILPDHIAHADWGTDPRKRQVAAARRTSSGGYEVVSVAPAIPTAVMNGDLRAGLHVEGEGRLLAGFDFPIGLPRAYAERVGVTFFPDFLPEIGHGPWEHFAKVAATRDEIGLHRPFYPMRPGGTLRAHLYDGLGLTGPQLRRRCEGNDAETMFWTLGGKQVGKATLAGWRYLAAAPADSVRYWPFLGPLDVLLGGDPDRIVVAETYPREFYRHLIASHMKPWSQSDNAERLDGNNGLLLSPQGRPPFRPGPHHLRQDGETVTDTEPGPPEALEARPRPGGR
jgi:hypothetical protein